MSSNPLSDRGKAKEDAWIREQEARNAKAAEKAAAEGEGKEKGAET